MSTAETPAGEYLSFEDLAHSADLDEQDVVIPDWGRLRLRAMSMAESDNMIREATDPETGKQDPLRINQIMVRTCVVIPALTDAQVKTLWATKKSGTIAQLLAAIAAVCGIGGPAIDALVHQFRNGR